MFFISVSKQLLCREPLKEIAKSQRNKRLSIEIHTNSKLIRSNLYLCLDDRLALDN